MKIKRAILILQVAFLLLTFGAVTFYFQYANVKKTELTSSDAQDDKSDTLPLAEEENGNQTSSEEEEEQDDDRVFHAHELSLQPFGNSIINLSCSPLLEFKEIHFEIVTPPPQV